MPQELESATQANDDISSTYWKSQLYISLWAAIFIGLIVFSGLFTVIGIPVMELLILPYAITAIPVFIGVIVAHFGFILDGRAIKKSETYDWRPWWWAYFIASWLTIAILVSPIYLYHRHQATGRPNKDDIRRKLSLKGTIIPWY